MRKRAEEEGACYEKSGATNETKEVAAALIILSVSEPRSIAVASYLFLVWQNWYREHTLGVGSIWDFGGAREILQRQSGGVLPAPARKAGWRWNLDGGEEQNDGSRGNGVFPSAGSSRALHCGGGAEAYGIGFSPLAAQWGLTGSPPSWLLPLDL